MRSTDRRQRYYASLVAAGLCTQCRRPNPSPRHRCHACTVRANVARTARKMALRAVGLCIYCRAADATPLQDSCADCRERRTTAARTQRDERRSQGQCPQCGAPSDSGACPDCRAYLSRSARQQRRLRRSSAAAES